jgi:Xaa-Pro aminopeptidase
MLRFGSRVIFTLLCLLPAQPLLADPLREDLMARRARLMDQLGPEALAIFWSAPTRVYSHTVNYEYRQDSNLLYLTGIAQEHTILVLMPGNATRREILFIREADPRREHWDGPLYTPNQATARSGIATVMRTGQFDGFIAAMFSQRAVAGPAPSDRTVTGTEGPAEYATFFTALAEGRALLGVPLEPQTDLSSPPGPVRQFAQRLRERFFGFNVFDAAPLVHELRQVKSLYEQDVLRRSVAISSEAHRNGMRAAAPGKYEYEVEAEIEATYLRHGAMTPGYPSIVGSGPNATILHYTASSRQMQDGELLLVDAAANYRDYTGDITRTYPVNGRFSREQRDIYEIVYEAQQAGERAAVAGARASDIQAAAEEVLRAGLARLGLVTDPTGNQFRTWVTHGFHHWIGMDVHDVGPRTRPLEPGMAFVIEPGIYIREQALDDLPRTAENLAFIEKVRPVVQRYKDVGVRIEDSYLLTASGLERLSAAVPRTIEEIEAFLKEELRRTP